MIGWFVAVLLVVLLVGMAALDISPRAVFAAGVVQIRELWARIKATRGK